MVDKGRRPKVVVPQSMFECRKHACLRPKFLKKIICTKSWARKKRGRRARGTQNRFGKKKEKKELWFCLTTIRQITKLKLQKKEKPRGQKEVGNFKGHIAART